MAKVKYDNTNVEPQQFKQPTPGLYTMKVEEANLRDEDGKNDIELVLEVVGGEFAEARVWTYVGLSEASAWKMREMTDAFGLPPAGELNTDTLIGKKLKVKINGDQYQGEYRARAGRFAPLDASVGADEAAAPAVEEAAAGDDGADDYSTWPLEDLVSTIVEDEELKALLPGIEEEDSVTDEDIDYLVGFLEAADAGTTAEYLAESPWDTDEPAADVDYAAMTPAELKEEIGRRGLALPTGRTPKTKLIKILEENDGETKDPFKS